MLNFIRYAIFNKGLQRVPVKVDKNFLIKTGVIRY